MLANISEKSYAADARYSNFYAGGDIHWSGNQLYCLNGNEVTLVDVDTSQVQQSYTANVVNEKVEEEDEDTIYCFAVSKEHLVTAHRSGLLRLWQLDTAKLLKLWKAQHKGPVVKIEFSPCGKIICSSGADSSLRLWDFAKSSCLCALKDFSGPASLLKFHPNIFKREIFAVGADNAIYCWNYESKKLIRQLRGHLSQVTSLSFQNDEANCSYLATVSRDKVLIIWQLEENDAKQFKVLPLYEELEGVCYLAGGQQLVVATRNGKLLLIDAKTAKTTATLSQTDYEIQKLLYYGDSKQLAVVTTEQNILIYSTLTNEKMECIKQLIGYNDEILDMCYLGIDERFLAVATNSKHFKLYNIEDNMNCKLIMGHKDTVMSLASARNFLLSAGKDHSIFLWQLMPDAFTLKCLTQQANSHTSTIGCIAFGYNDTNSFASVCQDGSMKVWNVDKSYALGVRYAAIAHDKEVNSVCFSPNNKIIATASQDKTAKLWRSDTNSSLGTLRGHTRGVWCVRFSPTDQIVVTSSSDCSLRIWSIASLSCLKRLEQDCTILNAEFIDHGKFIISAASDGLLKVWNIKTNTCVQSIDEHKDRVWSLAVSTRTNKHFYSGGADSKLIRYSDITNVTREEATNIRQETLQQEQTLQTLLQQRKQFHKAFMLALTLGKPKVSYEIISQYVRQRDFDSIKDIVAQLNVDHRVTVLEHVKAWSTNSRHCRVSNIILRNILGATLAKPTERLYNNSNMVEVLTPYVQRHFKRITELNKELKFLEFIVKCI